VSENRETTPDASFGPDPSQRLLVTPTVLYSLNETSYCASQSRVEVCLRRHMQSSWRSTGWVAPLTTAVTLCVAMATSTFRDFWGINADAWEGASFIVLIIAAVLAIVLFVVFVRTPNQNETIRRILQCIEDGSIRVRPYDFRLIVNGPSTVPADDGYPEVR